MNLKTTRPFFRVRFIAVDDGFDSFELNGDTGGMDVAFKFLINEYYSRDLSLKIRSVKREKALRGEAVTKNCAYVLEDIYREEYKENKAVIDIEFDRTEKILDAILSETQFNAAGTRTIEIAKKTLRKKNLSKELVDMLIKKVLVYSDNRIEIVWRLSGFMDCLL